MALSVKTILWKCCPDWGSGSTTYDQGLLSPNPSISVLSSVIRFLPQRSMSLGLSNRSVMMPSEGEYSEEEARKRFESALRGARKVGPREQECVNKPKAQPKRARKRATAPKSV